MGKVKELLVGDSERYNYGHMCIPQLPWRKSDAKLSFYTKGKKRRKDNPTMRPKSNPVMQ